jgi:hypothetical protein
VRLIAAATACAAIALVPAPALAWDAHGPRIITLLALDGMRSRLANAPAGVAMPEFLTSDRVRTMVADQSTVPDRWRSVRIDAHLHARNPEHYINVENLEPFGLTLETIPPLRYEYLRVLAVQKHVHPEAWETGETPPYDPSRDPLKIYEWPGFAPHAIVEAYGQLVSSMRVYRQMEAELAALDAGAGERVRETADARLEMARANVLYHMGVLSHFVGDIAQPLHNTRHFNGWVGSNPDGFTTDRGFHAYIDGGVLEHHALTYAGLKDGATTQRTVNARDPWKGTLEHVRRAFEQVRPLYELQKSGDLQKDPGKALITERLRDGADMLGAMYAAAWESSVLTPRDAQDFRRFDGGGASGTP